MKLFLSLFVIFFKLYSPAEILEKSQPYQVFNIVNNSIDKMKLNPVTVAIIDTGLALSHPDLVGNVFSNIHEKANPPNYDRDGNGYFNDVNGFDFVNNTSELKDVNGSGTHIAGLIVGINPSVIILPLRVINEQNQVTSEAVYLAIKYAISFNSSILYLSFTAYEVLRSNEKFLNLAMNSIQSFKTLVVVSAGDQMLNLDQVKTKYEYELQEQFLVVCSVNEKGEKSNFSNYGPRFVDICALGENLSSTSANFSANDLYEMRSGTNQAAALVAGAASLLLSINPNLKAHQIKNTLLNSSVRLQNNNMPIANSNGILNLKSAVATNSLSLGDIIRNLISFDFLH
ncbi:MAG: S8 family serine peptidase [Bdellovibrionaceae bacterium]|nr:S8 family serine peptidase [Pseudobdellovibrionaceae bacterium]